MRKKRLWKTIIFFGLSILICACSQRQQKKDSLFQVLDAESTGLHFSNDLKYTPAFNLFKYMYFYNGSGVAAGDFNNDGLIDLFFGSNQGQNSIFLNKGDLRFQDVTKAAKIPEDSGWSTGISVVDVNNDGLLDLYVCRVGQYETLRSKNQLLINKGIDNNGIPVFEDRAKEYGLDFSGFSTQAAFFDYDSDGDLDMFLLNHSVHQNNNFRPRSVFEGTYDSLSGDRIFKNDGSRFTDVTRQTGINSTAISYGLGIVVADLNLDGYPDLYIGNDFHENDYLYINQKNGTFKEEGAQRMMHTSQYSMGVDVADINNDGHPEIISMDMLPSDPYILKRSLGEDTYDLFHEKISMGYSYQLTRNNLQFNRRNGLFSETGLYSGIAATDWSWAPLWMDFDNDGLKDLFISNGIPKRMNDIDYVNFVTSGEVQQKITNNDMEGKDISLINKFPSIKLPNKFFKNNGDLSFSDQEEGIGGSTPTFSNGAAYADLDGDGDLDVVVNNIDNPVLLYENRSAQGKSGTSIKIKLKGPGTNINATGARVVLCIGTELRTYENYPVRGFLSSMEMPLHIGLKGAVIDSSFVVWPDNTAQRFSIKPGASVQEIVYQQGLSRFDFNLFSGKYKNATPAVTDITKSSGLTYVHKENRFVEFDREQLIPHMVSTEGPALAVGDVNNDGMDDVFLGSARNGHSGLFLQQAGGRFRRSEQQALNPDSIYERTDACFADVNKDGSLDLVVASGGNEFYGPDFHNTPRIYLNDSKGNFSQLPNPFGNLFLTASCIAPYDVNGDGYVDLCIGGRAVPWGYGEVPRSYLFLNNKNGTFSDVTEVYAKGLAHAGFVTQALWHDIDSNGDKDLLLSLQWGGIVAFLNSNGKLARQVISDKKGWWNFLLPCDVDGDGRTDLIAGNLGLNSRLKGSPEQPVRLYYNDFDDNGRKEQILTYYVAGKEIPFASKAELEKQIPVLKKKFLLAADLAKGSLQSIFGKEKLSRSNIQSADYFANAVIMNRGGGKYETRALPWEAQLTSFRGGTVIDANGDALPDLLIGGNYYDNNVEMGRYDADYGTVLINKGDGHFSSSTLNGLSVRGQVRHIKRINIGKRPAIILAKNNDTLQVLQFAAPAKKGLPY